MEMIFEQLIKRQNEYTALVERELTFGRILRMRRDKCNELLESQIYKFRVRYVEKRGIFVKEKNKLRKFCVTDVKSFFISTFEPMEIAEGILEKYGNTKIDYSEAERVWIIKKAIIEVFEHDFNTAFIIEQSDPYLPEVEEDEEE